jgi:hypothetical protein
LKSAKEKIYQVQKHEVIATFNFSEITLEAGKQWNNALRAEGRIIWEIITIL